MKPEIKNIINERIEIIETYEDFIAAMDMYKRSESDDKEEAMNMLKSAFPSFCNNYSESIIIAQKQAYDAMPDYSDIGQ